MACYESISYVSCAKLVSMATCSTSTMCYLKDTTISTMMNKIGTLAFQRKGSETSDMTRATSIADTCVTFTG